MHSSLRSLRIADLELFITAAHLENLSKAALVRHISQSAASVAIQRVERAFGRPLCFHEKRSFQLTPEGHSLLPKAEKWLKQLQETLLEEERQPIRLATTGGIARVVVPAVLPFETIDLLLRRPDQAYEAVIRGEADLAFVPDNALWTGVSCLEVGGGFFQLYSKMPSPEIRPVLLPENQIEVLSLLQKWTHFSPHPLAIKARIPSWSLIADICSTSEDVGFLPDFLGKKSELKPVLWQPQPSAYRILALHKVQPASLLYERIQKITDLCRPCF